MKLKMEKREASKKSQAKALRREGLIPAVIYHRSKPAETITIDATEFATHLRSIIPGHLSTTKFTLAAHGGHVQAILKDIQYNPVTYEVIHLDFEELIDDVTINVKVPVECIGVADCAGIKLGGYLRQVIRHVKVNCLPKDIPEVFQIDVKDMGMRDSKRIKDLEIPQNVRPLVNMNEVIVVIAKR